MIRAAMARPWVTDALRRLLAGLLRLRFVLRDGALEIAVLAAAEEAQLVERAQVLLRLGDVADHQVGLAEVLVRALVLRIEAQGLVVVLEHEGHVGAAALAQREGIEA